MGGAGTCGGHPGVGSGHLLNTFTLRPTPGKEFQGGHHTPPSGPRRPPSQGFQELQANDGNANNTGRETPEENAESDAQSPWSRDSDRERFSQSAGHRCYESTEVHRGPPIRETPNSDGLVRSLGRDLTHLGKYCLCT